MVLDSKQSQPPPVPVAPAVPAVSRRCPAVAHAAHAPGPSLLAEAFQHHGWATLHASGRPHRPTKLAKSGRTPHAHHALALAPPNMRLKKPRASPGGLGAAGGPAGAAATALGDASPGGRAAAGGLGLGGTGAAAVAGATPTAVPVLPLPLPAAAPAAAAPPPGPGVARARTAFAPLPAAASPPLLAAPPAARGLLAAGMAAGGDGPKRGARAALS
jgi:hypothetical protein